VTGGHAFVAPNHCPGASKTTHPVITEAEANDNQWPIQRSGDGTVSVDMCLQCQISAEAIALRKKEIRNARVFCCAEWV
jgi:hypothetical protein